MAKKPSSPKRKTDPRFKSPTAGKRPSKITQSIPRKRQPKNSTGLIVGYALVTFVVAGGAIGFLFYRLAMNRPQVAEVETVANDGWGPRHDEVGDPNPQAVTMAGQPDTEMSDEPDVGETSDDAEKTIQQAGEIDADSAAPQRPPMEATLERSDDLASPAETTSSSGSETSASETPAPEPPSAGEPEMEPPAELADPTENETDASNSGPLKPDQMERFEAMLGEPVRFEGVPFSSNASGSGKTLYLRFSQNWDDTIMVFMLVRDVGEDWTVAELEKFVGKTVRIDGVVERQFGTNRLGVRLKAKDQIEVVE